MGVVIEGCLNGIPSIGFSLCNHQADADFSPAHRYVQQIVSAVLKDGLPELVCLNVNFPDLPSYKGIKVCEQAKGFWQKEWETCPRENGKKYFWLTGEFTIVDSDNVNSDNWALRNGYVAVTPTTVDVTAYHYINQLKATLAAE